MSNELFVQIETYLRLYFHVIVPTHESAIKAMCNARSLPLELATTLEDIGQAYIKMAETLNEEIIRRDLLEKEPEMSEDFAESRISQFVETLVSSAGTLVFNDGMRLDGRQVLEASPFVGDAIKTAMLMARGKRGHAPLRSIE